MPDRNRVRVESNQRIDKPDFEAMQLGAHLAMRYLVRGLLFGQDSVVPPPTGIVTSAWLITTVGSELTVTPGRAVAGETMADASTEQGHVIGEDGDASQTIDFVALPADTYYVWARADFSPGVSGSRIFYNAATATEDAAAIDTREVSGWKIVASAASPGAAYAKVGTAVWDGAAFTSATPAALHLFEGDLNAAGVETGNQWGDGAFDRSAQRAQYGVQSMYRAFALIRRQLKDIIGAAAGGWSAAVPTSLTAAKTHIDTTTDPHGAAPTWTGQPTFSGGLKADAEIDASGLGFVTVDAKTDVRFVTSQDGSSLISGVTAQVYISNTEPYAHLGFADGQNARMNNSGISSMRLLVPLSVPEGATLTEVYLQCYWENQAGAVATVSISVWSQVDALGFGTAAHLLGSDSLDDTGVPGAAAAYGVITIALSDVRDALTNYFAYIILDNNGEAAKLSLVYIRTSYTFDNVIG